MNQKKVFVAIVMVVLLFPGLLFAGQKENKMEYRIEQIGEIKIAGIKTTTDNKEGLTLIPQTWGEFFNEKIIEKIDHKVPSAHLYAVYTEYESDENGKYTFLVGARVDSAQTNEAVNGTIIIPKGKYAVFTVPRKEDVIKVWQYVWKSDLKRNYISDFEQYDMTNEAVTVFVGLK